jgi:LmbE family N-acetylglucosaminyl deacetylase
MNQYEIESHIPQIRPHIRRRGRSVFFMIARRPLMDLADDELSLFESIDGSRTVAEIEKLFPSAKSRLLEWRRAAMIELIPPIASPKHPHLVVIEPHMDDAILSTGGRLLNRRGSCRITILSVVKWSNFTSYLLSRPDLLEIHEVSNLRRQESALVARILGADHRCLDWSDAPLRFWPPEQWSATTLEKFRKVPQDFVRRIPDPQDVSLLARQLLQELTELAPDELWIPMGLGEHLDHRTTRSACLLLLAESLGRFPGLRIEMYEDLPYAAEPGQAQQICKALTSCGTNLDRSSEEIAEVFEEKVRLASVYASQFKLSYIEPKIRAFAEREGRAAGTLAEAVYSMKGQPSLPPEAQLSRDWCSLGSLDAKLRALIWRTAKLRRLTVLALPSGHLGKWPIDGEHLVRSLPEADLRIYASSDVAWQAEEDCTPGITLQIIGHSWMDWISVFIREIFRFGTPTLVIWRGAYSSTPPVRPLKRLINAFIQMLLPFRRVLFTRRLSDFCYLLRQEAQRRKLTSEANASDSIRCDHSLADIRQLAENSLRQRG